MTRHPPRSTLFPSTTLFRSLRTMNSPPLASRAILCTPFLPISENLTAPDSTYMSVEPSPAFRTAVPSPPSISTPGVRRPEETTTELQSPRNIECRLLLDTQQ